jgi:hypothetical protein
LALAGTLWGTVAVALDHLPPSVVSRRVSVESLTRAAGNKWTKMLTLNEQSTSRGGAGQRSMKRYPKERPRSVRNSDKFERYNIVSVGDLREAAKRLDIAAGTISGAIEQDRLSGSKA